jgi:hypothetical protein
MKARSRVALVVAVSLLVAGTVTVVASALAYERSSPTRRVDLNREMFADGFWHDDVDAYLRAHPDAATRTDFDTPVTADGHSVTDESRDVQRRAQRHASDRSRVWEGIAIAILAGLAAAMGWFVAGRPHARADHH